MSRITRESLLTLEAYAKERPAFRSRVLAHKKARTVHLGDHVTLLFEDELTIRYQVQEMLRIEKTFEEAGIRDELDAYNALVPDGTNLKATMLIEYEDVAERQAALARLRGIERQTWLKVEGFEPVFAIADEDLDRENDEKTSAVHFLRFELDAPMIAALEAGRRSRLRDRPSRVRGRGSRRGGRDARRARCGSGALVKPDVSAGSGNRTTARRASVVTIWRVRRANPSASTRQRDGTLRKSESARISRRVVRAPQVVDDRRARLAGDALTHVTREDVIGEKHDPIGSHRGFDQSCIRAAFGHAHGPVEPQLAARRVGLGNARKARAKVLDVLRRFRIDPQIERGIGESLEHRVGMPRRERLQREPWRHQRTADIKERRSHHAARSIDHRSRVIDHRQISSSGPAAVQPAFTARECQSAFFQHASRRRIAREVHGRERVGIERRGTPSRSGREPRESRSRAPSTGARSSSRGRHRRPARCAGRWRRPNGHRRHSVIA